MASLSSKGSSDSWEKGKLNVARIVDKFVKDDPLCAGRAWASLPEEMVCGEQFYERLAYFLVNVYIIESAKNDGQPLACDTVLNYMTQSIQQASARFKAGGTPATQLFLLCTDYRSASDPSKWWRGLKTKIQRLTFTRQRAAGAPVDNSESALPPPPCPTPPVSPHPVGL